MKIRKNLERIYNHLRKEEYDKAIQKSNQILEEKEKHSIALQNRGIARIKKGELEKSLEDFEKIIYETQDTSTTPYSYAAHSSYFLDKKKLALGYSKEAIKKQAIEPTPYKIKGRIDLEKGNLENAITNLTLAIERNPKNPLLYQLRSDTIELLAEKREEFGPGSLQHQAAKDLQKIIKITRN